MLWCSGTDRPSTTFCVFAAPVFMQQCYQPLWRVLQYAAQTSVLCGCIQCRSDMRQLCQPNCGVYGHHTPNVWKGQLKYVLHFTLILIKPLTPHSIIYLAGKTFWFQRPETSTGFCMLSIRNCRRYPYMTVGSRPTILPSMAGGKTVHMPPQSRYTFVLYKQMLAFKTSLAVLPEVDGSYVEIHAGKMWSIALVRVPCRPCTTSALNHYFIDGSSLRKSPSKTLLRLTRTWCVHFVPHVFSISYRTCNGFKPLSPYINKQ